MKPQPDQQFILNSLVAVAARSGRAPSRSQFISLSGVSEHHISQFFPTWNDAVRAAGLIPHTINTRLSDRELLEDWAYAVRRAGRIPPRRAYAHLGQYDPRTFRRFGAWSKIPEAFRKFAQGKPEYADVLALLPPAAAQPSPLPQACPEPHRTFPPVPSSSSDDASAPDQPSPSSLRPTQLRHPPLDNRPTYGRSLDFRGLRYEPVNEQGVVLLFGMVARELGYLVEAVQSGFPDCEAQRRIAPRRWQRVHIEFEFESRNFRDHGHPLVGCDVIVCWRHNWPGHPPHLEILELSSLIKSLPNSAT